MNKIEILKILKQNLITTLGENIHDVVLFGSQITNEANEFSDFDVLIILKNSFSWKDKNRIRDICYDLSLDNDILIDSKIISLTDMESKVWGQHPLILDAIKNGIHA